MGRCRLLLRTERIAGCHGAFTTATAGQTRPFSLTVDGWAGTQRYGAVWTGDQIGGEWEYIRFQIPTYIGTSLSGQPNVGSDMDGIYGGGNPEVNVRDYQWKTFTPIQLNMDGWGTNSKNPFTFGKKSDADQSCVPQAEITDATIHLFTGP
ncbi:TIM-barrel domain-containing protein [Amylolactobacillus amylophilus]|uniref:TIM-barrel domain-containing protein n=1 Tax=Amylolactobacillus amylophilus TaxID=1603 RepID=UPI0034E23EB9